jgi:RimJ/RimL family protein N-acetyltransferase
MRGPEPILGLLVPEWQTHLALISWVCVIRRQAQVYSTRYHLPMTQCSSERLNPVEGLGWTPPDPLPLCIESERLIIRAYTQDDVTELREVVEKSREALTPWLPWCQTAHLDPESSLAEVMQWRMELRDLDKLNRIILGVYLKDTGELVGGSGIHDIRRDTASCETGYWASVDHRRKGYIEEACRRTISWALAPQSEQGMGLGRVRIYTSEQNTASTALVQKLDVTHEVTQRQDYFVNGYGCTTRLGWGVLSSEWDCQKHCSTISSPK